MSSIFDATKRTLAFAAANAAAGATTDAIRQQAIAKAQVCFAKIFTLNGFIFLVPNVRDQRRRATIAASHN
jgi:hypothetical protein